MARRILLLLALFAGSVSSADEKPVIQLVDTGAIVGHAASAADALNNITDIRVNASNLSSVASVVVSIMEKELRGHGSQIVDATFSMLLGAVMLWNGLHVFEVFILIMSFFSVFILMMGNFQTPEYTEIFGGRATIWQRIMALEVAILVSFSFKHSIGLVKKFLGLSLGIFAFLYVHSFLEQTAEQRDMVWLEKFSESPAFFVLWGTVAFCAGVWAFSEGPSYVFAIVAPAFGGVMVSSSIFFFASMKHVQGAAWIDFVECIFGKTNVGVIRGSHSGIPNNQLASATVAFLLFAVAAYFQVSAARAEKLAGSQTVLDKILGCLGLDNCVNGRKSTAAEPLLAEKQAKIKDLESKVRVLEAQVNSGSFHGGAGGSFVGA